MKVPKIGDKFFTGFELEYTNKFMETLLVKEVEGLIIDKKGNEGRSIMASDGIGYDCFWSEKKGIFVYGLGE